MNYSLTSPTSEPPGGWRYHEIRTKADFKAGSLDSLVGIVVTHYEANPKTFGEVSVPTIRQRVINQICEELKNVGGWCQEVNGIAPARPQFTSKCCGKK